MREPGAKTMISACRFLTVFPDGQRPMTPWVGRLLFLSAGWIEQTKSTVARAMRCLAPMAGSTFKAARNAPPIQWDS